MVLRSRSEDLLIQEVSDELIVYDRRNHQTHRLNRMAARVWRSCDGRRTPAQVAELLALESDAEVSEEIVRLAIGQLEQADLIQVEPPVLSEQGLLSRREMLARVKHAYLLPVVASIVAPLPLAAQSPLSFSGSLVPPEALSHWLCVVGVNGNGTYSGPGNSNLDLLVEDDHINSETGEGTAKMTIFRGLESGSFTVTYRDANSDNVLSCGDTILSVTPF